MKSKHAENICGIGTLSLVLMLEAIKVIHCHYMLTPSMKSFLYDKFYHLCLKQENQFDKINDHNQRTRYSTEGKLTLEQQIHI